MKSLGLLLLFLFLVSPCSGIPLLQKHLFHALLPNHLSFLPAGLTEARSISIKASFSALVARQMWQLKPVLVPSVAPAPSSLYQGPVASPAPSHLPGNSHQRRRRHVKPISVSPPLEPDCSQICAEPFTSSPLGSPCGCVIPMKIQLLLGVSLYTVFPLGSELQIEIAEGTYIKQRQVVITGATADSQNQGKVLVDINLLPLGDKFDETTAMLIFRRFWLEKIPINKTLFGDYQVVYINYPGISSPPPTGGPMESGQSGNVGSQQHPLTANVINHHQKMSPKTVFIIAFSGLVLSILCCVVLFILIRSVKNGRDPNVFGSIFTQSVNKKRGAGTMFSSSFTSSPHMSIKSAMPTVLSVRTFSLLELEKATHGFSSQKILGEGGFGRVYHGVLADDTEVAVKLLMRDNQNGDHEFVAEVEMLSRLHHRNLVKLVGICAENHIRCLVYDLIPNGSVGSHLHGADKGKGPLDWDTRLKIALGAARGLAYLHEDSNPRVIHRDFKASNVLLEDDFTPRVSDFGLAREATEGSHHISTRVMGTFGYVAPEYAMTGHLLVKSDVYSYGVVLLELLTGKKPVDMSQPPGQENLVTWARPLLTNREGIEQLIDPSLAGTYNFDDVASVTAIASMCVNPEVSLRPFMGEVVQALKLVYNDKDEMSVDFYSHKDSSARGSDFRGDFNFNFNQDHASTFLTMDYSSGPLEETDKKVLSESSFLGGGGFLPIKHGNRSGPLRTIRSKVSTYRFKGSMSEHSGLLPKRAWNECNRFESSL